MTDFDPKKFMSEHEYGCFKYAQFENGYRFCHNDGYHRQLKQDGERVISAGFVEFDTGKIRISLAGSMGLRCGPSRGDEAKIAAFLGCGTYERVSF